MESVRSANRHCEFVLSAGEGGYGESGRTWILIDIADAGQSRSDCVYLRSPD